jgi:hypothetical protein
LVIGDRNRHRHRSSVIGTGIGIGHDLAASPETQWTIDSTLVRRSRHRGRLCVPLCDLDQALSGRSALRSSSDTRWLSGWRVFVGRLRGRVAVAVATPRGDSIRPQRTIDSTLVVVLLCGPPRTLSAARRFDQTAANEPQSVVFCPLGWPVGRVILAAETLW